MTDVANLQQSENCDVVHTFQRDVRLGQITGRRVFCGPQVAENNKKMVETSPGKSRLVTDSREEDLQRKNDAIAPHIESDDAATREPSATANSYFARFGYSELSRKRT